MDEGFDLYNRGEFFAAHEAWEALWRVATDEGERRALQGLIQVAAGYYKMHEQRKRESGARLLARGLAKLEGRSGFGLALEHLRAGVRATIAGETERPALLMRYQPYYCEENAFKLCGHPAVAGRSPAAVFIRGAGEACVMWGQRAAPGPGEPVVWDYHVVVLVRGPWEVWDLDTTLGFPAGAADYLRRSFRPELALPREVAPWFRVVPAEALAATFASDRSHMRAADGAFTQAPPPWPPIGAGTTLMRFLELEDPIAGEVLELRGLLARVA